MSNHELYLSGQFYSSLCHKNKYDEAMRSCIENTLYQLMNTQTTVDRPGMLLGNIQSGKTRAFIGITGLAFDQSFHITIVLTKGTKALARQTYERLKSEFAELEADDAIQIYDIMKLPETLTRWERKQKLIFVVKKQRDNLSRLADVLFHQYPDLGEQQVLIIDDEADYASIGFSKTKQETHEMNKIARQIDELRKRLVTCAYLQVTATPYSLYLQPENLKIPGSSKEFLPVRPAFTELVPVYDHYIGGHYYFEESENPQSAASHLYIPIEEDELTIIKERDRRRFKIEESLMSPKLKALRCAVMNFIVGSVIRRLQAEQVGELPKKYSFIIHTEFAKDSHAWQEEIVNALKDQLTLVIDKSPERWDDLLRASYENLLPSIQLINHYVPPFMEVKHEAYRVLKEEYMLIMKVNSEADVDALLDETGQLRLRTPLNIFIGGQILDRGITVGNLIGFYYGRNPRTFQQDTVLQHARMFGYRSRADLAVTRFYTTLRIYEMMERIQRFDSALREAFETGGHEQGVVFIQNDLQNDLVPCSPNKLLLSHTVALKPFARILPYGFQTKYKTYIEKTMNELDQIIHTHCNQREEPFLLKLETAIQVIELIKETYDDTKGKVWNEASFISSMRYLATQTASQHAGYVWCIVREGREMGRIRQDGTYENAPDGSAGEKSERRLAKEVAKDLPALLLLRQNGKKEKKWREAPFWWPVLVAPEQMKTVIFSEQLPEVSIDQS